MGGKKSKAAKPAKTTGGDYSTSFSVVMIGELGVGKSSLVCHQIMKNLRWLNYC